MLAIVRLQQQWEYAQLSSSGKNNFPEAGAAPSWMHSSRVSLQVAAVATRLGQVNFSVTIIRAPFVFAKLWGLAKSHLTPAMPGTQGARAFLEIRGGSDETWGHVHVHLPTHTISLQYATITYTYIHLLHTYICYIHTFVTCIHAYMHAHGSPPAHPLLLP